MRQSKVAKSFEAQRRVQDADGIGNEALAEREADRLQRRGPRDHNVAARGNVVRSRARIIEDEANDVVEDVGRLSSRNAMVQRMNERNKPTPRIQTPDDYQRGRLRLLVC